MAQRHWISRDEIAEIHEAISRRTEGKHSDWHAYAAKVIRENENNSRGSFTFAKHWQAPRSA